jgi:hypothetical protein
MYEAECMYVLCVRNKKKNRRLRRNGGYNLQAHWYISFAMAASASLAVAGYKGQLSTFCSGHMHPTSHHFPDEFRGVKAVSADQEYIIVTSNTDPNQNLDCGTRQEQRSISVPSIWYNFPLLRALILPSFSSLLSCLVFVCEVQIIFRTNRYNLYVDYRIPKYVRARV